MHNEFAIKGAFVPAEITGFAAKDAKGAVSLRIQ